MTRKPPPDFLIAGAPKCGTTAVYKTLQQHPSIFLPTIKEPHYFAYEYADRRAVETLPLYDSLFAAAGDEQIRGDASVMYLSSLEAIPAVLKRRPDVRVIALVRNPIHMFVSWHNQCIRTLDEDVADPESAWRLQEPRSRGLSIPRLCHEPLSLQYRKICSVGTQVGRLVELVPVEQRLVLVYDDVQADPRAAYKRIVEFLGVEDDGRMEFLNENAFARTRSTTVAFFARSLQIHPMLKTWRLRMKPFLNRHGIYLVERLLRRNLKPAPKPNLRPAFSQELLDEFEDDIHTLERILDRDLSVWRKEVQRNGAPGYMARRSLG